MHHKHFNYPDDHYDRRYVAFTAAAAAGLTGAALATAGTIGTVAIAGAGAYAASRMFGGSKASSGSTQPAALPEAPSTSKAEVAAQEDIEKKRRAVARNQTIFTSPFGLAEEDKSGLATKTLLGE